MQLLSNLRCRSIRRLRDGALLGAVLVLSACAYFPKDGPSRSEVTDAKDDIGLPFTLIDASDKTLDVLDATPVRGFAETFGDSPATEPVLGVGDSIGMVVFEAGSEPLFSNGTAGANGVSASRGVTLPEQTIALDGTVSLPFAGRLHAAGLTAQELQQAAEKALGGRASHPQIVVSAAHGAGGSVTVLGEGGPGSRIALSAYGERVLDVLAGSGGLRGSVFDTWVELRRAGTALRLPMSALLNDPQQNVRLHPGDLLLVTHQAQSFTVFGAAGRSAQIDFGAERVTLTQAVAKAGGLQDARADPRGVFLFRYELPAVAEQLGINRKTGPSGAPVVYQFDFLQTSSYFTSQRFALRDGDVLFIASAPVNELTKFLSLIGLVTQPAVTGFAIQSYIK